MKGAEAARIRDLVERHMAETPIGGTVFIEDLEPIIGSHTYANAYGLVQRARLRLAERGILFQVNPAPHPSVCRAIGGGPMRASYTRLPDRITEDAASKLMVEDVKAIMATRGPEVRREISSSSRIRVDWFSVAVGGAIGLGLAAAVWIIFGGRQ